MTKSKLDHALDLARRGFAVFPLVANSKVPAIKNWQNEATTDLMQIGAWWTSNPDYNIGAPTANHVVVDVDPRNGGDATFAELTLLEEFPKTARAATRAGGAHIFYALPPHTTVKGGTDKLGRGVDVKSWGGYVVAAGSTIDGKPYAWANERPVVEAPKWLIDRCNAHRPRTEQAGKRLVEEDDEAVRLARAWLANHAPDAHLGAIDDTAFKVAARFYDFGVSAQTATELLTEWSDTRAFPPMQLDRIQVVAESAGRNRDNPVGTMHPGASGFEAVDIEAKPPNDIKERPKFYAVRADDGARRALESPGEPLIKGIIHRGTLSVLVGAPGGGKTFFVLDWCYHVAKGLPWAGRPVKQGAVVYLAAEAGNMIMARLAALQAHYGPLGDAPLYVVPCPADFAHGAEDAVAVLALIQEVERESGQKVELFVIDTLARAIAGGDENSSKDVGALIKAVDFIRDRAKTHALVIHHPGKDETKGGRGHSSVLGAADTEMVVSKHILTFTKQRDMPLGDSIPFGLRPIRIGTDAEGEAVTSCFVAVLESPERVDIPLTRTERELLEQIDEALQNTTKESFDWQWVQQNCPRKIRQKNSDKDSDKVRAKSSIIEPLSGLSEKGWLEKPYDNQYVRTCRKLSETVGN